MATIAFYFNAQSAEVHTMVPIIKPMAGSAPSQAVAAKIRSSEAINSITPTPILPHGSMPMEEKI